MDYTDNWTTLSAENQPEDFNNEAKISNWRNIVTQKTSLRRELSVELDNINDLIFKVDAQIRVTNKKIKDKIEEFKPLMDDIKTNKDKINQLKIDLNTLVLEKKNFIMQKEKYIKQKTECV